MSRTPRRRVTGPSTQPETFSDPTYVEVDPSADLGPRLQRLVFVLNEKGNEVNASELATLAIERFLTEIEAEYIEELSLTRETLRTINDIPFGVDRSIDPSVETDEVL